jgi:thymidine phosphorylase
VTAPFSDAGHRLRARLVGIDTHSEAVLLLRKDSPVCRSEGFAAMNRVLLANDGKQIVATLYQTEGDLLEGDEAGLSDAAWKALGCPEFVRISHLPPVDSLRHVRGRIYGAPFSDAALSQVIADIVAGRYSSVEIASFLTACAARPLAAPEILALTRAMVETGARLSWQRPIVADKHSVGGLPGNRTTPIIVSIVAALGIAMPKTSSRAITSPAGTADTMEVMAPVALAAPRIAEIVRQEGGCIAWGGGVSLSPADDILIRIERALDIDTEGQMIASVLSKKIAAGATHLVVDMPVGPTAKVRSAEAAASLGRGLLQVSAAFGIKTAIVPGDGTQPVGRGIGPALEARDVLAVLKGAKDAPEDLKERALSLAGALLELCGAAAAGEGKGLATAVLDDGRAWEKFQRICAAQGGMREVPDSQYRQAITAADGGTIAAIDNRKIARLAKLSGAPDDKAAGVEMHVRLGQKVRPGELLCTVHAEAPGELAYALAYAAATPGIFEIA